MMSAFLRARSQPQVQPHGRDPEAFQDPEALQDAESKQTASCLCSPHALLSKLRPKRNARHLRVRDVLLEIVKCRSSCRVGSELSVKSAQLPEVQERFHKCLP